MAFSGCSGDKLMLDYASAQGKISEAFEILEGQTGHHRCCRNSAELLINWRE